MVCGADRSCTARAPLVYSALSRWAAGGCAAAGVDARLFIDDDRQNSRHKLHHHRASVAWLVLTDEENLSATSGRATRCPGSAIIRYNVAALPGAACEDGFGCRPLGSSAKRLKVRDITFERMLLLDEQTPRRHNRSDAPGVVSHGDSGTVTTRPMPPRRRRTARRQGTTSYAQAHPHAVNGTAMRAERQCWAPRSVV